MAKKEKKNVDSFFLAQKDVQSFKVAATRRMLRKNVPRADIKKLLNVNEKTVDGAAWLIKNVPGSDQIDEQVIWNFKFALQEAVRFIKKNNLLPEYL